MNWKLNTCYLVCYDISDPERWRKVHKFLRGEGLALQLSVFAVFLEDSGGIRRIVSELGSLIDRREDDVRFYPVAARSKALSLGRQWLPDGLKLPDPWIATFHSGGQQNVTKRAGNAETED